jgi:hypothetical protein
LCSRGLRGRRRADDQCGENPRGSRRKPESRSNHVDYSDSPGCAAATGGANGRTRTADRLFTKPGGAVHSRPSCSPMAS